MLSLDQIKKPVAKELIVFEDKFRGAMKSSVPLLDKITWYIVQKKGKQVRPILVLLSARMFSPINEATYTAASMIELLHTATLVHDDVVDDANERRGFFSVNALWKNKIAVLVGDFLLSQGLLISVQTQQYKVLEIISKAVREMAEGELLQIEKARKLDIKEAVYHQIIRQKTASLIAAACCAGTVTTTIDEETIKNMWLFGEKTGMAFQIRDDLFDFGSDDVGKPLGIDIKEKKMTLPLIYTLSESDKSTRRHILNVVRNESNRPEKVQEVIQIVRQSGGIEYATQAMYQYRQQAFDILENYAPSDAKQALKNLLVYVTERKR